MTKGKKKCEILKTIRCQVAKKNGIPYTYTECTYQGECRGTCPKCEEELRYLTRELEKLKKSGKQVAVAGVAAAVITASATACSSDIPADLGLKSQTTMGVPAYTRPVEPDGDVAYTPDPEETEELEIMGDMLPPEEEYSPTEPNYDDLVSPDDIVLAGEPAPVIPFITDVIADLRQGNEVWLDYFERTAIQVEWEACLTESGEDYDIFTVDGDQIIVVYQQDGWGDSVTLYDGITVEDGQ